MVCEAISEDVTEDCCMQECEDTAEVFEEVKAEDEAADDNEEVQVADDTDPFSVGFCCGVGEEDTGFTEAPTDCLMINSGPPP